MNVHLTRRSQTGMSAQSTMKAARIHQFGSPDVIVHEDMPRPRPADGEAVVRVMAAGVGPWDAWVRAGKSAIRQALPLTLGADLSGIVDSVGPQVEHLRPGDQIYGVTNKRFTGSYAEYATVSAAMVAPKPPSLDYIHAASIPVVAVTAWQMLFDYAHVTRGQRVMIHGAAGNVGAYAVQLARWAGAHVQATAHPEDLGYVRSLGANVAIDTQMESFDRLTKKVDVVLDTVGGEIARRSYGVINSGGILVSAVAQPDEASANRHGIRAVFFLVDVTTRGLTRLTDLFESGILNANPGQILPLCEARTAHEMLEGAPHKRGRIVLNVANQ